MKHLLTAVLIISSYLGNSQDFSLVKEQLLEEDVQGARKTVQKILEKHQESAEGHYWLGAAIFRTYTSAELNPDKDQKLLVDAGISFEKAKFLNAECLERTDKGQQLKSYSGKVFNLAVTNYQDGDLEMAFTFFKMASEASDWLGDKDTEAMFYTGHCANKLQDHTTAKLYLEKVLAKEPSNVKAIKELLTATVSLGELTEGKALLKNALVHHPDQENLWQELMLLSLKMEDKEEALSAAQTLSHLNSKNPQNFAFLASLYDQNGNSDKAITSYRECLNIDPEHPKVSYNLGVLLYNKAITTLNMAPSDEVKAEAMSELEDAKAHLKNAQSIDPTNQDITGLLENIKKIN